MPTPNVNQQTQLEQVPTAPVVAKPEELQAVKDESAAANVLAAALTADPTTEAKEAKEFKDWNEVSYFHVDDSQQVQVNAKKALSDSLGIEHRLGVATSAPEALRDIEALAEQNQPINVIVLDQCFFLYEGDEIDDPSACRSFLEGLAPLLEKPETKDALKNTVVVMYSGTADTKFFAEMQKICPRVKALADKGQGGDRMAATVATQLADAGIVNPEDEKVRLARQTLSQPHHAPNY